MFKMNCFFKVNLKSLLTGEILFFLLLKIAYSIEVEVGMANIFVQYKKSDIKFKC